MAVDYVYQDTDVIPTEMQIDADLHVVSSYKESQTTTDIFNYVDNFFQTNGVEGVYAFFVGDTPLSVKGDKTPHVLVYRLVFSTREPVTASVFQKKVLELNNKLLRMQIPLAVFGVTISMITTSSVHTYSSKDELPEDSEDSWDCDCESHDDDSY